MDIGEHLFRRESGRMVAALTRISGEMQGLKSAGVKSAITKAISAIHPLT